MQLPEGTHLAYIVMHETAWNQHLCQHDRYNKGQPTLMVQASAHGDGGGAAWEFEVVEVDIDGPTVEVKLFSDAFAAFAQIPEFFQSLADQGTWATLDGVRSLLEAVGAVDETDRQRRIDGKPS